MDYYEDAINLKEEHLIILLNNIIIEGNNSYEPRDEVKGDIARILLYMSTMYSILTLDDNKTTSSGCKMMGTLSVLLG